MMFFRLYIMLIVKNLFIFLLIFNANNIYSMNVSIYGEKSVKMPNLTTPLIVRLFRHIKEIYIQYNNSIDIVKTFAIYNNSVLLLMYLELGYKLNINRIWVEIDGKFKVIDFTNNKKLLHHNKDVLINIVLNDQNTKAINWENHVYIRGLFDFILYNNQAVYFSLKTAPDNTSDIDHSPEAQNVWDVFRGVDKKYGLFIKQSKVKIRVININKPATPRNSFHWYMVGKLDLSRESIAKNEITYTDLINITSQDKLYYFIEHKQNNRVIGIAKPGVISKSDIGAPILLCTSNLCKIFGQISSIDVIEINKDLANKFSVHFEGAQDKVNVTVFVIDILLTDKIERGLFLHNRADFNYNEFFLRSDLTNPLIKLLQLTPADISRSKSNEKQTDVYTSIDTSIQSTSGSQSIKINPLVPILSPKSSSSDLPSDLQIKEHVQQSITDSLSSKVSSTYSSRKRKLPQDTEHENTVEASSMNDGNLIPSSGVLYADTGTKKSRKRKLPQDTEHENTVEASSMNDGNLIPSSGVLYADTGTKKSKKDQLPQNTEYEKTAETSSMNDGNLIPSSGVLYADTGIKKPIKRKLLQDNEPQTTVETSTMNIIDIAKGGDQGDKRIKLAKNILNLPTEYKYTEVKLAALVDDCYSVVNFATIDEDIKRWEDEKEQQLSRKYGRYSKERDKKILDERLALSSREYNKDNIIDDDQIAKGENNLHIIEASQGLKFKTESSEEKYIVYIYNDTSFKMSVLLFNVEKPYFYAFKCVHRTITSHQNTPAMTMYYYSKLDSKEFISKKNMQKVKDGIYKTSDNFYLQVIDSEVWTLGLYNSIYDISKFQFDKFYANDIFKQIFIGFKFRPNKKLFEYKYFEETLAYINVWKYQTNNNDTEIELNSVKEPKKNNETINLVDQRYKFDQPIKGPININDKLWLSSNINILTYDYR